MQQDIVVDRSLIKQKREEEQEILKSIVRLNNFVFAVTAKEDKRVMAKWKNLCQLERDFETVDARWADQKFYIYAGFRFPEN